MQKSLESFIAEKTIELLNDGWGIRFVKAKRILWEDGSSISGIMCPERKELWVAINHPFRSWVGDFAHEYAHYQQIRDNDSTYRKFSQHYIDFEEYCQDPKKFTKKQARDFILALQENELNADQRVVRMIDEYGLNIDKNAYIQESNYLLLLHRVYLKHRKWVQKKYIPAAKKVIKQMPTQFLSKSEYSKLPREFEQKIKKFL